MTLTFHVSQLSTAKSGLENDRLRTLDETAKRPVGDAARSGRQSPNFGAEKFVARGTSNFLRRPAARFRCDCSIGASRLLRAAQTPRRAVDGMAPNERAARKTILITGCSSGIGLDAALTLDKLGWRVFAACRQEKDVLRLRSEHGLETCLIDYTKPETIESGLAHVLRETGGTLDALFNNGAYGMGCAAEDVPVQALREIFECNFFGWHDLTCRVVKVFRNQGGHGRIVQCSSILGNVVFPMRMAYSATKFALEAHCDSFASSSPTPTSRWCP